MTYTAPKMGNEKWGSEIYMDPISADPFAFFIGGIGAVGVGSIADEYRRNSVRFEQEGSNDFLISTLRTFSAPLKSVIRFCLGGLVRVLLDTVMMKTMGKKVPAVAGGLLGILMTTDSRSGVLFGCTLGLALFFQAADYVYSVSRR